NLFAEGFNRIARALAEDHPANDADARIAKRLNQMPQPVGSDNAIGVGQGDHLSAGAAQAGIACGGRTALFLAHDAEAVVVPPQDPWAIVARRVVDAQHLEKAARIVQLSE